MLCGEDEAGQRGAWDERRDDGFDAGRVPPQGPDAAQRRCRAISVVPSRGPPGAATRRHAIETSDACENPLMSHVSWEAG